MSITLEERIRIAIKDKTHVCMLKVAVGHVVDLLSNNYDAYMDFGIRNNQLLEATALSEPDRLKLTFNGLQLCSNLLTSNIESMLPDSYYLSDYQVDLISDSLSALYVFLTEDNIKPEEMTEYG